MAVLTINPLYTSRGGKDTFEKHRTYKRVFEVICDDPVNDTEASIGAAMVAYGVSLGTPFPTDLFAYVTEFEVEQDAETPFMWHVTVSYDSKPDLPGSVDPSGTTTDPTSEYQDSPLNKPAKWRYSSIDVEEPLTEWRAVSPNGKLVFTKPDNWAASTDYTVGAYVLNAGNAYRCTVGGTSDTVFGPVGNSTDIVDGSVLWDFWSSQADILNDPNQAMLVAVTSSGLMPFDPPAMETVSKPILQVTKNIPLVTLPYLMQMKNAVNSTSWRGVPPRCAKITRIEAGNEFENGVAYVSVTWDIALDPDTHDKRVLDCAWGAWGTVPDSGGKQDWIVFKDSYGNPYSEPCPLNGKGQKLVPPAPAVYMRGVGRQTKIVDFNALLPF